jgi:hypothetical protein
VRPDGLGRDGVGGEADGLAEWLARPTARAVAGLLGEVPGLATATLDGAALLGEVPGLATAALDGAGLVRDLTGVELEAARVGGGVRRLGAVAGLNVATESIAPATRQTARMLASKGMIAPCPARGPASRRSRLRRRFARSSR